MAKILKEILASSELLFGNTVYFEESGDSVPYLLVGKGNSKNLLFMRKYAAADKAVFNKDSLDQSNDQRIYEGNTLDIHLSSTFFDKFTSEWQRIFVDNNIYVTRASDGISYAISRKIYAPSATELGITDTGTGAIPVEGSVLTYFQTSAQSKRRCQYVDSNGDYLRWWTRTKNNRQGEISNYYAVTIEKDGTADATAWQINDFGIRPILSINENVSITKENGEWRIIPNLPPDAPESECTHYTMTNGETIELEWGASNDVDGPDTTKYRVQKCIDNGSWVNVAETTDTTFSKVLLYKEAESRIDYRVQAFDSYDNTSEWTYLAVITVVNNLPPSAPSTVQVVGKYRNENVVVSWGSATDEDGNLKGYNVYRSVNGGSYALINTTSTNSFREVAGEWDTVKYKVHAYDEAGAESIEYVEAETTLIARITMSISVADNSDITEGGVYSFLSTDTEEDLTLRLVLSDTASDDKYIVLAVCDNSIPVGNMSDATTGNISFVILKDTWQKLRNGTHKILVSVENSAGYSLMKEIVFEKKTNGVYLTLANPVIVDSEDVVKKFLLNVVGSFPEGSSLVVEVTNNANDDAPVWQTVSDEEMNSGLFVDFTNTVAENGNAFNFRLKAERGTATDECYISSINGMFGENTLEYILARLDALEAGAANV